MTTIGWAIFVAAIMWVEQQDTRRDAHPSGHTGGYFFFGVAMMFITTIVTLEPALRFR